MVEPVHTKVAGRGRYKVDALVGSEWVKEFLESALKKHKAISYVSGNTITGTILVCFNSGNNHDTISLLLHKVVSQAHEAFRSGSPVAATQDHVLKSTCPAKTALSPQAGLIGKIRKKMSDLVAMAGNVSQQIWHALHRDDVVSMLETSPSTGLSVEEAQRRYRQQGPNMLPATVSRSKWDILVNQFMSLPVGLLGVAAALSLVAGGVFDALVIMGVVVANGMVGYYTEDQAEKTIRSLKSLVQPLVPVIRDGRKVDIATEEVVLGDLLILKPGTYVAADSRIVDAHHLTIDESVLTGESMPARKTNQFIPNQTATLGDRFNMAYMGTVVTGGEGLAVVVATGVATEVGRLKILLEETTSPQTPSEKQLARIGDQLVLLSSAVCGLVFVLGFFRGYGLLSMLRMSVSLAAAAVPEGLPAAATTTLALGIKRMKKHHALIRNLNAVETLGTVQTVCLDKTGTITRNRMAVVAVYVGMHRHDIVDGEVVAETLPSPSRPQEDLARLIAVGTLCNETHIANNHHGKTGYVLRGSPTERAFIKLAEDHGADPMAVRADHKILRMNHRSEKRLFMSSLHVKEGGERFLAVKGSPPEVLSMCDSFLKDGRVHTLTDTDRLSIRMENERMAAEALRVLGLAYAEGQGCADACDNKRLVWLGLVGMADPIRRGVKGLIKAFHRAGIDTVMITGDQSPTAYAVAKALDISKGEPLEILDSSELALVDSETMKALGQKVHVYARVSPADKLKIVQAIQSAHKVVAMTGDGINDGPALKAADVGIAMGHSGTDVAREVADVILEKDNLDTLIMAVKDGRTTHANIRKSVHFFLSTNLSEIMVMFTAMAAGIGFPLNAMQLLWINLISDIFPGLALSLEAPEPDVLEQPPLDSLEFIFTGQDYKKMAYEAGVISAGTLGAYLYGVARYGLGARAASVAFQSLTIGQLLHAVSCRSERGSIFDTNLPPNRWLNMALTGSLGAQLLTIFVPGLRRFLGITPLGLLDGAVIAGTSLLSLVINEMAKKKTDQL